MIFLAFVGIEAIGEGDLTNRMGTRLIAGTDCFPWCPTAKMRLYRSFDNRMSGI
jgi:hypothetical protein